MRKPVPSSAAVWALTERMEAVLPTARRQDPHLGICRVSRVDSFRAFHAEHCPGSCVIMPQSVETLAQEIDGVAKD